MACSHHHNLPAFPIRGGPVRYQHSFIYFCWVCEKYSRDVISRRDEGRVGVLVSLDGSQAGGFLGYCVEVRQRVLGS